MLGDRYYLELAAAFSRGKLPDAGGFADEAAIESGRAAGLRLHKFKRNTGLPRVRRVLGILRGLAPSSVLDIGSGRGTFLWPLLDQFPNVPTVAIDISSIRTGDIDAVRRGGVHRLSSALMDATALGFGDGSFDVVTILEVLEHVPKIHPAVYEAVRVARRFVIASMPSKDDENPEHIDFFGHDEVLDAFGRAGAAKVVVEYVPGHMIALARR
ncbi:MAG TPA: class I SAM-dependent methyltransferase [Blastocatellia bacterium]|nr:class I SAM-dependent methyltransferase [Blastocatellia bacterium]